MECLDGRLQGDREQQRREWGDMAAIRWLFRLIGWRAYSVILIGVLQCVRAGMDIGLALLMKNAIDGATNGNMQVLLKMATWITAVLALDLLLYFFCSLLRQETWLSVEKLLRRNIYGKVLGQQFDKMSRYHTGELMNRLFSDVNTVAETVISLFPQILYLLCRITGVVAVLSSIAPTFTLIFIGIGMMAALMSYLPKNWLQRLQRRSSRAYDDIWSFIQESLTNFLTIYTFRCEKKVLREGDKLLEVYRKRQRSRSLFQNVMSLALFTFMELGYYGGFVYCGIGIVRGTLSYGALTAVLQLIGQAQSAFSGVGSFLPRLSSAAVAIERLSEFVDTEKTAAVWKDTTDEPSKAKEIYEKMDAICFDQVSFGYEPEELVLERVSFEIKKGEFVALVGDSGSGKSTIMKLLLSVYIPVDGNVFCQTETEKLSAADLPRGLFAYVPQGNYLMSGKIWQVVGLVDPVEKISLERVKEACRIACVDGFIEGLPQQYETELGERGTGLSEGQIQRIAIARAIYSGYPILLLDEATSALDEKTEKDLMESLRRLKGRTVLLVTHRRDAWRACDRVITVKGSV